MDVIEDLRQRFEAMKYQDLRQEAKKHGLSGNLKKAVMIDQLVVMLENQHVTGVQPADIIPIKEDQQDPDENSFHTAKPASDDEVSVNVDEDIENVPQAEEKLNRTFEINESDHAELLKTLGDVAQHHSSNKTAEPQSEAEKTAQSPMIRPRKRPETIAKHFASLHDKLNHGNETLDSYMEKKRARHASLTRGIPSRVAELAKPKNPHGVDFTVEDIDKLNLDFSRTLISPRKTTVRRASSHGALNRMPKGLETPKLLTADDKNNSRSVDRLRLELLAKPKRSIHGSAMDIDPETPKKSPILRAPVLKRSSSVGAARRVTQVTKAPLDFDDTLERPAAVPITPRIEQLAKPKPAVPAPAVKKASNLRRSKSYRAYTKPFVFVDTTKMSDAQYREYLAKKKDSSRV